MTKASTKRVHELCTEAIYIATRANQWAEREARGINDAEEKARRIWQAETGHLENAVKKAMEALEIAETRTAKREARKTFDRVTGAYYDCMVKTLSKQLEAMGILE